MKAQRTSNFEILRIVAIIMIIFSHFCGHGLGNLNTSFSLNGFISSIFTLGNLGVVIFMMISGYFLANSSKIKWNKIIKLLLTYYFYILLFYFLSLILKINEFSFEELFKTIFALFFEKSWFVPIYILIYLFHPFINKIFDNSSYKTQTIFVILLTICWSVIPTLFLGNFGLNNLVSLFCCYCYGVYLRRSKEINVKWYNKKVAIWTLLVSASLMLLSVLFISLLSEKYPSLYDLRLHFYSRQSILTILLSASCICLTSLSKTFYCKPINFVSGFSLGIYLIHDNDSIRNYLWHDVLRVQDLYSNNLLPLIMIGIVLGIFVACLIIDIFRTYIIEKPVFFAINKIRSTKRQKDL